ncbi:hypothetical protein ROZALSC1DRAFT_27056 [Rozella allomycis CSF55]|uniref:EKC/KEOPS complex subunit CGI121 n=1 Tax=Rozella allomycis (strain CSF55) TaxID=988480 RepID=A0A075AWK1_ROZAC|nr:hypothetical protein O9G_001899 [Rozella allomycis CSF55]RKP21545.1 hypothetical protein ROZALSC1DRAFT_27056 [Rozella allomycis CSF55]|eukprot:EPZ34597.1 hypothetical protein O9G_001899 [Rozella allomycis CSF55]
MPEIYSDVTWSTFLYFPDSPKAFFDLIRNGNVKACVLNASTVHSIKLLNLACLKASNLPRKTRTIFTDVIYYLSLTKSIQDSLKTFGWNPDCGACLLCLEHDIDPFQWLQENSLKGTMKGIEHLNDFQDRCLIDKRLKTYQNKNEISIIFETVFSSQYNSKGVEGYYLENQGSYRNHHFPELRRAISVAMDLCYQDLFSSKKYINIIDIACGSGEAGCDPYTQIAYENHLRHCPGMYGQ